MPGPRGLFATMGRSYKVTMANGGPEKDAATVGAGHARDRCRARAARFAAMGRSYKATMANGGRECCFPIQSQTASHRG